ncbi:sigma-70 family RNA polymerase sigma factor [Stieleria varia]|uniref:RNA polymerase sigma-D factor n=1 Tax=Stieleria varia TaxID=2528005 RepID=A0A5C6AQX9_9BACT|nr:sigma-70 family RNA polymerase sigma factor [Stieleria varia]TWU02365.1 RNA polymerase sigma-D factor [Stieleria varia]
MNHALTEKYRRASQESLDQLILDNVPFVARILSTMDFTITDPDERENLHSAGILGLVKAANQYDPSRGVSFRTFAYPAIRGAIVDELRALQPVSQMVLKHIGMVRRVYESLEPPVTPEQLAEHSGLKLKQVIDCLEALRFIKPDDWNDLSDVVHDSWRHNVDSPEHALEMAELNELVASEIESLGEQERMVVTMYHRDELNMPEIGEVLGLSVPRISRIMATALFRIKEAIRCKTM